MKPSCVTVLLFLSLTACKTLPSATLTPSSVVKDEEEPIKCITHQMGDYEWETCDTFDQKRADYMRSKPVPRIPGHPSSEDDFVPDPDDGQRMPGGCMAGKKEFAEISNKLLFWLDEQGWTNTPDTLSRDAAWYVREMISSFIQQINRDAQAKGKYAPRHKRWEGDAACQTHYMEAKAEIERIGHLIIDEMNKGNYELAGTGLNPYARKEK